MSSSHLHNQRQRDVKYHITEHHEGRGVQGPNQNTARHGCCSTKQSRLPDEAAATGTRTRTASMRSKRPVLCAGVNAFESSNPMADTSLSSAQLQYAAPYVIGPRTGPLPASSMPRITPPPPSASRSAPVPAPVPAPAPAPEPALPKHRGGILLEISADPKQAAGDLCMLVEDRGGGGRWEANQKTPFQCFDYVLHLG